MACGYLFYALDYNPMLLYLFSCLDCSSLGHRGLFHLPLQFLWHTVSLLVCLFLSKSLLSGTTKRSSSFRAPPSAVRVSHFSKAPRSVNREGVRIRDLEAGCVCSFWGVAASRPSSWRNEKTHACVLTPVYTDATRASTCAHLFL